MGGMTRLLLLLWAGVTASTVVDLQKRVIGGQPCRQDERRYHVELIGSDGVDEFLCGGSLITDQWILTATHCWEPGWTITAVLGRHPDSVHTVNITAKPKISKDKYFLKRNKIHDIMLLKLPDRTPIPTQIQPVRLPDCGQRPNIVTVEIAGYGANATAGPNGERSNITSDILHCAETDIVDCQRARDCLRINDPLQYKAGRHSHWFCGQRNGVDASPGDSGGGAVYNDMIYGVISFTGNHTHACTEAVGFMDVCNYMGWINKTIAPPSVGCFGCG